MKKFNQTFAGLLVLTVAARATATLKAQTQNSAPLKLAQTVTLPGYIQPDRITKAHSS
jgi:hypothetical protein